ncbi:MAG: hypothetical protein JW795_09200 [Chitinivibrionales bacterium]|nr:hypothetical protein [Chitinivibrionales bacterium]
MNSQIRRTCQNMPHFYHMVFLIMSLTILMVGNGTGNCFGQDTTAAVVTDSTSQKALLNPVVPQPAPTTQTVATPDASDIIIGQEEGKQDAQKNVKKIGWFAAGCISGVTGWIISMIVDPNPPVMKLLGKSPAYVQAYVDAYKDEAKKIQRGHALLGCITNIVVYLAINVTLLIAGSQTN